MSPARTRDRREGPPRRRPRDWRLGRETGVPCRGSGCRATALSTVDCRSCQVGVGHETRGAGWRLASRQVSRHSAGEQVGCSGRASNPGEQPWRVEGGRVCRWQVECALQQRLGVLGSWVSWVSWLPRDMSQRARRHCARASASWHVRETKKKTRQLGSGTGETVQNKASRKAEGGQVLVFAGAARSMRMDNPEGWEAGNVMSGARMEGTVTLNTR